MNKVIKTHPSISLQRLLQKNACSRKNSDKRSKKSVGRNVRGRIAFKKASMRKEEAVKVRRGEGHGNNQRKIKKEKNVRCMNARLVMKVGSTSLLLQ